MSDRDATEEVFRHNPAYLITCVLAGAGMVFVWIRLIRGDWIHSAWKAALVVAILVVTQILWTPVVVRLWRSSLTFRVTATHLLAVHQFKRTHYSIEWRSIESVKTVRPVALGRSAARQFSCISTRDGTQLLFAPHLSRYSAFVEELRKRATACRVFDPFAWYA